MPRARQALARIAVRLLAFNLLLVFVPIGGVLYLDTYERHLLEAQERGMIQQGRLLAAVLADEQPLDAARVTLALQRLDRRVDARLRIVDRQGALLGDSSVSDGTAASAGAAGGGIPASSAAAGTEASTAAADAPAVATRERLLYRVGAWLTYGGRRLFTPRQPFGVRTENGDAPPLADRPEVKAALAGRYGAATRVTSGGQRSLTLHSAIPIRRGDGDEVIGAVVISQTTYRLLQALYDVRLQAFKVVVGSMIVAVALTLVLAATIIRPLARLRAEAHALLDRRRGAGGRFSGAGRLDEIGDLARALQTMTDRLSEHVRFVEAFAADAAHELKNPIAAIRAVADALASAEDPRDRARFAAMLQRDVERLDRLVSGLREVVHVDAQLDREPAAIVDLAPLLANIAEARRLDRDARGVTVAVAAPAASAPTSTSASASASTSASLSGSISGSISGSASAMSAASAMPVVPAAAAPSPWQVRAAPDRLVELFGNLVDNAVSFSPDGGVVTIALGADGDGRCLVSVEDEGPGIPEAHRARIFDRFFSYRPAPQAGPRHTGLGLAIAKAIVEGYGGSISAANRPRGGARFEVRLPRVS